MTKPTVEQMRRELSAKERQKNLDRFLKDSAVKDRLYHGTSFAMTGREQGINDFQGKPIAAWVGRDPKIAEQYSNKFPDDDDVGSVGQQIYPVHVSTKKPFKWKSKVTNQLLASDAAKDLAKAMGVKTEVIESMIPKADQLAWQLVESKPFVDLLKSKGYDSIHQNERGYETFGVFHPHQIKSATGNRGTYDPNDPDITKADGGVVNLAKGGSVNIGINVATDRKAGRRYADLIVDGHKSLESRNSDSLRPYVGKRVAIVRTGEGPAKAIGEVTIGEPMVVNKKKFRALEDQHLVPEGSSFDINTPTKHLYPMHDPVRYDDERDVGHGIIARKLKMADGGKVNIENTNGALDRALAAARKEQAYREMEEYLKARGAVPDIKVGFLPSQTAAEFQRTILPVGTGTIKVNRNRLANQAQEALPATLMHELAHAVDRQISQQAAEQAGVPNQFTEAYAKLVGSGEQRRADIARKLDPEWEKRNRAYRSSPRELAGHGMGAFVDNTAQAPGPRHVDATAATELAILMDLANRNTDKKPKGLEKIPAFLRGIGYANGGTVNQGGTMPTLAEMRAMLMKRGNPIELQSIGVNEAPGLSPKAYMPPDRAESFQPAPGGVATQSGMPIGGIDQSRMMPGQQLMPQQPGQAPGTSEQPGRSATGQPQGNQPGQQPSPLPTGFGPMGSMEAQPSAPPSGAGSNILSMTPQGRALNAIGPAQKPQGMARGGTAKMGNIPAALLNRAVYGNRYINEAATTKGEQTLAAALSGVNTQMASGQGLYKQGDTTSRIPGWAMNKMGKLNPATYSSLFPRTNSYFLPDYAEMDPTQFYHGQVGALDKAFVNAGKAASRDNPEYVAQLSGLQNKYDQMRLANQNLFSGGNTSEDLESRARQFLSPQNAASNNFQRQNANIPMAFDAARGDLTPEQAFALQQTMGGTYGTAGQGGISNAAQQRLDMIQNTLAGYQRDLAGFNPDQLRKFQPDMTQEQIDARRADLQKQIDLYGGMLPGAQQDLADWQKNYAGYQQQFAGIDPTKLSSADLLTQLGLIKKPGGMATGGSVKQQGVTMGSPKSTRMVFQAEGSGGVKGINVPRHMWEGSSGVFQKGTRAGQEFKTPGMKDVNAMRAKVYGSENRDPLTIGQIGRIHKDTLAEHFKKPIEDQVKDEKDALGRLREAGHIGKTANTLDESEKLDTVRHEHDEEGRTHVGYASKGVAGHALYTSGHGKNMKHHVINTCPGQTEGCGGGKDAKGIVDTTKGTCFAPVAEAQYPGAAIRRASHEQAKHDPAMTRDWILAHTGSIREAANAADKKNQRMLFRPNVVDETDTSSRHVIRHLNEQRKQEDKPGIIANSYGKTNELHDPENGYYVTHSNVGPKVKQGREISENIGRDRQRVSNTIMAANAKGVDFSNEQGNKTPPKGSYMVTNVKRGSPLSKKMQEHITHAKYWSTGRDENELSDEEKKEGPEGHYGPSGRKTTPEKAHYGHTTLNGRRYDYQKQHILHPRLVQVGENKDGTPHMIPTDSRFKDTEFLPKDRFKTKNGKEAGHILMTTPTESTSNLGHETSFTHHVDDKSIKHAMSNNGEYEIDKPEDQEKARGKEYAAPQPISIVKKAGGGSIESRHPGLSDDDFHAFPERNFAAQRHLAMRRGDDEARAERPRHAVVVHKNTNTMRHEMMTRRKG